MEDEIVDPIVEPTNDPPAVITEPVDDPSKIVHPKDDAIPEWGQALMAKVDALSEQVSNPPVPTPDGIEQPPADESPVRLPWTHRPLFG